MDKLVGRVPPGIVQHNKKMICHQRIKDIGNQDIGYPLIPGDSSQCLKHAFHAGGGGQADPASTEISRRPPFSPVFISLFVEISGEGNIVFQPVDTPIMMLKKILINFHPFIQILFLSRRFIGVQKAVGKIEISQMALPLLIPVRLQKPVDGIAQIHYPASQKGNPVFQQQVRLLLKIFLRGSSVRRSTSGNTLLQQLPVFFQGGVELFFLHQPPHLLKAPGKKVYLLKKMSWVPSP